MKDILYPTNRMGREEMIEMPSPFASKKEVFEQELEVVMERNRMINISEVVTFESVKKVFNKMVWMQSHGSEPIHLFVSTEGGNAFAGMWLAREIQKADVPVVTYIQTATFSAGALIFLAGHVRIMYPDSMLMLHGMKSMIMGNMPNMEHQINYHKTFNDRIGSFISETTNLEEDEINAILKDEESYWFPEQAIKNGACDCVFEGFDIQPIFRPVPDQYIYIPKMPDELKRRIMEEIDDGDNPNPIIMKAVKERMNIMDRVTDRLKEQGIDLKKIIEEETEKLNDKKDDNITSSTLINFSEQEEKEVLLENSDEKLK